MEPFFDLMPMYEHDDSLQTGSEKIAYNGVSWGDDLPRKAVAAINALFSTNE